MWNTILNINSIFVIATSGFWIYSIGAAILTGAWTQLGIATLLFAFFMITEVIFGQLAE